MEQQAILKYVVTTKEEELVYDVATDDTDNVKINPNPSYDLVSRGVKLERTIK